MKQVVRLLLQNDENKILLVKHGKENPWAFPGGHIEDGESIYDTAYREIQEEFNLDIELVGKKDGIDTQREELEEYVKPISIYSVDFFSRKAGKQEKKLEYIFLGKITGGNMRVQEEEIYEFRFFEKKEIVNGRYEIYSQIIDLVKKYI